MDKLKVLDKLLQEQDYDSGLLNNYGGGDINWWHDYLRTEIDCCNQYWRSHIEQYLEEENDKLIKYWMISHSADTTETGLFMRKTYVKSIWKGHEAQQMYEKSMIEDLCFERFGKKTNYVQGVAPCDSWKVSESTKESFVKSQPIKWGGMATKTERIFVHLGSLDGNKIKIVGEETVIR